MWKLKRLNQFSRRFGVWAWWILLVSACTSKNEIQPDYRLAGHVVTAGTGLPVGIPVNLVLCYRDDLEGRNPLVTWATDSAGLFDHRFPWKDSPDKLRLVLLDVPPLHVEPTVMPTISSRSMNNLRIELPALGRNFADSLRALVQGLHEIANEWATPSALNLTNRRRTLLNAWNSTCQSMEIACNGLSHHSIVIQYWAQLSLELLGWMERSGGHQDPALTAAQRRWTKWMNTCGQEMSRNQSEALGRDKHTPSPSLWGTSSNLLQESGMAPQ
ncbi:MAG: hypothetical protein ACKO7X_04125, partial [Bacteroidota bacterium]